MFIRTTSLLACLLVPISASATVTLNIGADQLKTSTGDPMPTSGLVILAASTLDGIFGAPTPGSFFSGDDIEVARWSLNPNPGTDFGPGVFNEAPQLTLSGNWNATDPLQLYWFPENTVSDLAPVAGQSYGVFRDDAGKDGGDPWITPADGSTISLHFYTSDSLVLDPSGGSYPASAGLASLTVVPEPSTYAAVAGVGCFAWAVMFRAWKKRED